MALQIIKELEMEHITNQTSFKVLGQSLVYPYVDGKPDKSSVECVKLLLGEQEQCTQFSVKILSRVTLPFTVEQIKGGLYIELIGAKARPYVRNGYMEFTISAENFKLMDSKTTK